MKQLYIFVILAALVACSNNRSSDDEFDGISPGRAATLFDILWETYPNPDNIWGKSAAPMPDDGCVKMKINPVGGPLAKVFNDSNYLHLQAAAAIGIHPLDRVHNPWDLKRPIEAVESNEYFMVDRLTHSYPFLVPEAHHLLNEIGQHFMAEQAARGGGEYRLKVTSLLRTPTTVAKLRRRNRNATEQSAHQYGTTFDISYAKFIYDGHGTHRTQEDLKNLLAEVLYKLRDEGRCYVKYEKKQGCFHITTRP